MNGYLCRYVLLVIDVFSRFLWLRPLESKSSQVIANELVCIYMEYGSPEIIQCDQGTTANLYNIDIQIVSSLRIGVQHAFNPSASVSAATVYLGHFAENQGE